MAAKGSLAQARLQQEHSDGEWQRDQRLAACTALLDVVDRSAIFENDLQLAAMLVRDRPADLPERYVTLIHAARAAVTRVDLTGPESVRRLASELGEALEEVLSQALFRSGEGSFDPLGLDPAQRSLGEAHEGFRVAASTALGFAD